jgi:hypothetical protein
LEVARNINEESYVWLDKMVHNVESTDDESKNIESSNNNQLAILLKNI